jgi:hypothetical protein
VIKVDTNYLDHSGGTKFYETVRLVADDGKAMLIKRYAKLEKAETGGETKIHRGDESLVREEEQKILADKTRGKNGERYEINGALRHHGLHKFTGKKVDWNTFVNAFNDHYSPSDFSAITHYFSDSVEVSPVMNAQPEPEFDRGADWGAF